jgi:hypothetical protein
MSRLHPQLHLRILKHLYPREYVVLCIGVDRTLSSLHSNVQDSVRLLSAANDSLPLTRSSISMYIRDMVLHLTESYSDIPTCVLFFLNHAL